MIATAAGDAIHMIHVHADRNLRHSIDNDERIIVSSALAFALPNAGECRPHARHSAQPIPASRAGSSADAPAGYE